MSFTYEEVVDGVLSKMCGSDRERWVTLRDELEEMRPVYDRHNKFTTTAILVGKDTGVYYSVGVAKRNPIDMHNETRGRALALSRAVMKYVNDSVGVDTSDDSPSYSDDNSVVAEDEPPRRGTRRAGRARAGEPAPF